MGIGFLKECKDTKKMGCNNELTIKKRSNGILLLFVAGSRIELETSGL